jgi:hypothetical protein
VNVLQSLLYLASGFLDQGSTQSAVECTELASCRPDIFARKNIVTQGP